MPTHVILLPPSEGKAPGGRTDAGGARSFPELDGPRAVVREALAAAMADEPTARALLGVKGTALEAAREANRALGTAPLRPAIERYTGVLYDALDTRSMPGVARARMQRQVIVLSGLWGLLRPQDAIPDYKLKMDAVLPPLGRLSRWWREDVTAVLDAEVAGRLVWDLLPKAHAAAWISPDAAPRLRVTVSFATEQHAGGAVTRSAVTHWSKALKGALARHLVLTGAVRADRRAVEGALGSFRHPHGYALEDLGGEGAHLHATFLAVREG